MRRVQQRPLTFFWLMTALFLLGFVPGARALAPASSESPPDPLQILSVVDFGKEVSILADFDGDHHPDLLTGRFFEGAYRFEIRLSSDERLDTSRSLVSDRKSGIVVLALDVDGDNDLDLVISDGFSLFPKAVWLGDGKGHFENGDPLSWLGSFAVGEASTYRTNHYGSGLVASGPTERFPFDRSQRVSSHVISVGGGDVEYGKHALNRQWLLREIAVRGPPFICQFFLPL